MVRLGHFGILSVALLFNACSGNSAQSLTASAKVHLEKKESKAAAIELKNALTKDPKHAEARFLLGKVMLDSGDVVGADVELQKAQELGYDENLLAPLRARIVYAKGDPQKVISQFGNLMLQTPSAQTELSVVLAPAYLAMGKNAEAQSSIDAALKASPNHVGAQLLQVRILGTSGNPRGAMEALEKVIEAAPASSEARQIKGELLSLNGQQDLALAAFEEAIDRDRSNIAAHSAALWILLGEKKLAAADLQLQQLRAAAPQSPQTMFFSASIAFEKGELKSAGEQAQRLLQQAPESVIALQLAGAIELAKGAVLQAQAHLAKALAISPSQQKVRLMLAQSYLRAGDAAQAIKLLQPMVDKSAQLWEPQVLMAQAQMMNGDSVKAETYFTRAVKLNPQDTRSLTALALAQVAKGQIEQGFQSLRNISEIDIGTTADLALVNGYLRQKDYDNALKAIRRIQGKQPKSSLASNLRGQTELLRGQRDQARTAFIDALQIDPTFFPAVANIASLDMADGKLELAQQRLEAFALANPNDIRAGMALVSLMTRTGAKTDKLIDVLAKMIKVNPAETSPRLALVGIQIEKKDFKTALTIAQQGLSAAPDNPELLDALGQAQYYAGDINQAVATYNRMAAVQPTSPQPFMRLAEIYRAQNEMASSTQSLRKALSVKPDFVPAHQALMAIDLAAGRWKEALNSARTVQRQPGNEALGFSLEGDLELSQKNWVAAAGRYRQSLAKQASADIAIKLHNVLLLGGQTDEASKFQQRWGKQYPNDPAFQYYLGDVALKKLKYDVARQHYEAVVKIKPDSAPSLNNIAWLLGREGRPEALNYALKAVSLAPKEPAFLDTLAEIYARNGDFTKAVQTQAAAVAAGPEISAHRLRLASYYLSSNDKAKARIELERLVDLGPKFAYQAEVKAMLAKL